MSSNPPELTAQYHSARSVVVAASVLIALWWSEIGFGGNLPLLNVTIGDAVALPRVLGAILLYGTVRLLIEWLQSPSERRKRFASRVDLTITLLIAAAAFGALVHRLVPIPDIDIPTVPVIPSIVLVLLSLITGEVLNITFMDLFLIRSKEEAQQLSLPRVPVAVRGNWALILTSIAPLNAAVALVSPAFAPPLDTLWPWFLLFPATVVLIAGILGLLLLPHKRQDGTKRTFRKHIRDLRQIFDWHDAMYQVGGWDKRMPPSATPLYRAAEAADIEGVRRLLRDGADPNAPNTLGWTALMIAAANQHLDCVRLLLEAGADPNTSNLLGRNALMFAARYGNIDIVRELLAHGADPNQNRGHDFSALSAAAMENHRAIVELLLESGADPTLRDSDGRTAREYAEKSGKGDIAGILRVAERKRAPGRQ